jgi:hypothetical protein
MTYLNLSTVPEVDATAVLTCCGLICLSGLSYVSSEGNSTGSFVTYSDVKMTCVERYGFVM